jgi:hypothetical protein
MRDKTMIGAHRTACHIAALLLAIALAPAPAKAQLAPSGGAGGDMMTQMAPMIEMMKAKMGKRRFGTMMQTMGPMMSKMMEGGSLGGFGGIPGGIGGLAPETYATAAGGNDIAGMLGGSGGSEMMSMIPQIMQMAGAGFGRGHGRRHHRRHS